VDPLESLPMAFRFLHLADLHLQTVFGGRPETRQRLRDATLEAWDAALAFALDENLNAILIAGDAFDDKDLDRRIEMRFRRGIEQSAKAGIHVLYCCGNHDPGGKNFRASQLDLEGEDEWQTRVHFFNRSKPRVVTITDREGEPVGKVVGVGHPKLAVSEDLVAKMGPETTDLPVVGLVHTQVTGAQSSDEHEVYAPSTKDSFKQGQYDYWALGHVHRRQQVFDDLPVWYAGNLQGRNPKRTECGPKGGLLVELEAKVPPDPTFVAFAPVTWEELEVDDLADLGTTPSLISHLSQIVESRFDEAPSDICVRLWLSGACPLSHALMKPEDLTNLADELTETTNALEVQLKTRGLHAPRDLDVLRATPSVVAETLKLIEDLRSGTRNISDLKIGPLAMADAGKLDGDEQRDYLMSLLDDMEETYLTRALEVDA
jgi:DNA repair protein SbcD/Mre11